MPYTVQIRKNGRVYGTLGPYAQRADALADAAVLKRPGLTVSVESAVTPVRANAAPALAAAGRVALQLLLPIFAGMAKDQIREFLALDRSGQIELLRKRAPLAARLALANDAVANMVADSLVQILSDGKGEVLVDATTIAAAGLSKNPKRRSARRKFHRTH